MYTKNFYNKNLKTVSRELRNNETRAEKKIWYEFLRSMKPKVHRQRPMGKFVVDFYIPKARLIIEIDGGIHQDEKIHAKDTERDLFFKSFEIMTLRFSNDQVFSDLENVCARINDEVVRRQTPPPYGHPLLSRRSDRFPLGREIV